MVEEGLFTYERPCSLEGGVEVLEARSARKLWRVFHETYTFCLIEAGGGDYVYRRGTFCARPGTVHLLEPGNVHRDLRAYGASDFAVLFVQPAYLARLLGVPPEKAPHLREGLSRAPRVAERFAALLRALRTAAEAPAVRESSVRLFSQIFDDFGETRPGARAASANVGRAVEVLQDRWSENVTLEELANVAGGVSPSHLVRTFQRTLGMTPHQYLLQTRIDRVRRLLQAGVSVTQAAHEAGFADQSHLHRHFRRIVGVTPGRYARTVAPERES